MVWLGECHGSLGVFMAIVFKGCVAIALIVAALGCSSGDVITPSKSAGSPLVKKTSGQAPGVAGTQ